MIDLIRSATAAAVSANVRSGNVRPGEIAGGGTTGESAPSVAPPPVTAVRRDLAAALATLGIAADEPNLLAAQALVRFGVPLSVDSLSDVRRAVAARLVRLPETVALAKSLGLPPSPAVLRALDTLLSARTDTSLLTISVPVRADTNALATHLRAVAENSSRSVENKLLSGDIDAARSDLRSYLLRQAQVGDTDAEAAARHLEGQLLVTSAKARASVGSSSGDNGAILVAFVAAAGPGRAHYVEMSLRAAPSQPPDHGDEETDNGELRQRRNNGASPETSGATAMLHLPTTHLGLVSARLHLSADGRLLCRLNTHDPRGAQRLERTAGDLGVALARAGFVQPRVEASSAAQPGATAPDDDTAMAAAPPRARATHPLRALDIRA